MNERNEDRLGIPGDRERSVSSSRSIRVPLAALLVSLVVMAALGFIVRTYFQSRAPSSVASRDATEEEVPPLSGPQGATRERPPPLKPLPKDEPKPSSGKPPPEEVPDLEEGGGTGIDEMIGRNPRMRAQPRDRWASALVREQSSSTQPGRFGAPSGDPYGGSGLPPGAEALLSGTDGQARTGGKQFADRLRPVQLDGSFATRIPNRSFVITQGMSIGKCRIDQAVNTELPGFITCTLANDVRSTDGETPLMTAGSRVRGEYHTGLALGEQRFFALWTRYEDLETGVIVQLDSPATDSLGRAGIAGTVDTKALQRFGPPLFFSVLTDLPQYLAQRGGGTGTTINAFSNTQSASQEALRSIIELYSRLSPTLTKDPAGVVTIIAARDLDFSGVYPPRKKKVSR